MAYGSDTLIEIIQTYNIYLNIYLEQFRPIWICMYVPAGIKLINLINRLRRLIMRTMELVLASIMLLVSGAAFAGHGCLYEHEIANYINTAFNIEDGTFTENAYAIQTGALEMVDENLADDQDDPSHLEMLLQIKCIVLYNLACLEALENNTEEAFMWLEKAIDTGFNDQVWMESDTDLTGLREDTRFDGLIQKIRTAQIY